MTTFILEGTQLCNWIWANNKDVPKIDILMTMIKNKFNYDENQLNFVFI